MKKIYFIFLIYIVTLPIIPTARAQQIRAVSFNIQSNKKQEAGDKNTWVIRRSSVIEFVRKTQPTVMGVQDALLDQLAYIDNSFHKKYRRISVGADNGITRGAHNAIYYDTTEVELLWHTTRWLSKTPQQTSAGWDETTRRTVTIALFREKQTNKKFYFLNTCLGDKNRVAYKESVKLLSSYVDEFGNKDIPVLLCGTFNASDIEPALLLFYDKSIISARRIATKTDFRDTYNAYGKDEKAMIDHIFTQNIFVDIFKTFTKNYGTTYISSHYPIGIMFSL